MVKICSFRNRMCSCKYYLSLAVLLISIISKCEGSSFKFLNIKYESLDKHFGEFKTCRLKVIERGVSALYAHFNLYEHPVNNITLSLSLWRKANGYHPFLYNYTVDFCNYMKHRARYPFANIVLTAVRKHSNINHTCPYDHDIIIDKMVLDEEMLRLLPIPTGEYLFMLHFAVKNDLKIIVKAFTARNED